MKKLILMLLLPSILLFALHSEGICGNKWVVEPSIPDYRQPALAPGGVLNPYEIRETPSGKLELSTPLPAPGRMMEPGSPLNPIEIKRRGW